MRITSMSNDPSLGKINSTCQIYAVAMLLKTRLTHYMFHELNITNVSVNIIRLFEATLTSLESIVNLQWQIYVREKYIANNICIYIFYS